MHFVSENDHVIIETPPKHRCLLCDGDDFRCFACGSVPRAGGAANDDVESGDPTVILECQVCGDRVRLTLPDAVTTPTFDLYEAIIC